MPQPNFSQIEFERIDLAANARRYYLVAWQPNLYGEGTLIRMFGRMGRFKRVIAIPCPSLQAAWPMIRAIVRTRLRHGYHIL
ncbi:MAG: WGR domain-containing protein [Chloroflexi bacterium]|nr:WGR domain-containing protein [Chloroflexota bacterium]